MTKIKVIELVGQKLDPKAKYVFLIHYAAMRREDVISLADSIQKMIGNNFVIGFTHLPVNESMKVFEVLPSAREKK